MGAAGGTIQIEKSTFRNVINVQQQETDAIRPRGRGGRRLIHTFKGEPQKERPCPENSTTIVAYRFHSTFPIVLLAEVVP